MERGREEKSKRVKEGESERVEDESEREGEEVREGDIKETTQQFSHLFFFFFGFSRFEFLLYFFNETKGVI